MKLKILIFFCLLSFALSIDFPWMYYLPYGETVTLKPLFRNKTEDVVIQKCKWTTPNNIEMNPDILNFDLNRYFIDKMSCELTIFNIQKDTNGVYHCTINDFLISKAMLNVHGAPKASLWEEYTPNLIAGLSTAGGNELNDRKVIELNSFNNETFVQDLDVKEEEDNVSMRF